MQLLATVLCQQLQVAHFGSNVAKGDYTHIFLLLRTRLSERRPLLFLLHVRIIIWVGRVVAGVTVGMEYISCAEFVDRSKGNTRCIPETYGAVLVSVNGKKIKTTQKSMIIKAFLPKNS